MILDAFDSALCIFACFILNFAVALSQESERHEDLAGEEHTDIETVLNPTEL